MDKGVKTARANKQGYISLPSWSLKSCQDTQASETHGLAGGDECYKGKGQGRGLESLGMG